MNAVFEVCGSVAVWMNFVAMVRDRGYAGTRLPMMVFFTSWGFWNLFFYSGLHQELSYYASIFLTSGNCAVVWAMAYFGRKE
jgi:hypothetical protein